jgi:hypothetical protein
VNELKVTYNHGQPHITWPGTCGMDWDGFRWYEAIARRPVRFQSWRDLMASLRRIGLSHGGTHGVVRLVEALQEHSDRLLAVLGPAPLEDLLLPGGGDGLWCEWDVVGYLRAASSLSGRPMPDLPARMTSDAVNWLAVADWLEERGDPLAMVVRSCGEVSQA